ncbi:MAG: methionyl-tRNA formyltransferase [Paracoccaceae bacterium]
MRLVFMGTPDFSVPVLQALLDAGHDVARVYTQPPRPAGRGKSLRPSPVQKAAEAAGLDVETPERFRDNDVLAGFQSLNADAAVVVAYGQILPKAALDAPRLGCLNLHASLLPRWRGAAPIQRAIMAGDAETGVAVMQMDVGLDTGDVLAEARTPISIDDTAATLHDRLAGIGAPLMAQTLADLHQGTITPCPQPEDGIIYAHKIDKAEARIDWTRSAADVDCHIRGLSPFPGSWCEIEGDRVKVLLSRTESPSRHAPPGTALDDNLLIACGESAVRLLRLQRAGKSPAEAEAFLNGLPLPAGTRIS